LIVLPAMPLEARSSAAVPPDCSANDEFVGIPDPAPVELLLLVDAPVEELEPVEALDPEVLEEPVPVDALSGGWTGAKLLLLAPNPILGANVPTMVTKEVVFLEVKVI
jgi:hypothetical protein